jgi:hypothetical protein
MNKTLTGMTINTKSNRDMRPIVMRNRLIPQAP